MSFFTIVKTTLPRKLERSFLSMLSAPPFTLSALHPLAHSSYNKCALSPASTSSPVVLHSITDCPFFSINFILALFFLPSHSLCYVVPLRSLADLFPNPPSLSSLIFLNLELFSSRGARSSILQHSFAIYAQSFT